MQLFLKIKVIFIVFYSAAFVNAFRKELGLSLKDTLFLQGVGLFHDLPRAYRTRDKNGKDPEEKGLLNSGKEFMVKLLEDIEKTSKDPEDQMYKKLIMDWALLADLLEQTGLTQVYRGITWSVNYNNLRKAAQAVCKLDGVYKVNEYAKFELIDSEDSVDTYQVTDGNIKCGYDREVLLKYSEEDFDIGDKIANPFEGRQLVHHEGGEFIATDAKYVLSSKDVKIISLKIDRDKLKLAHHNVKTLINTYYIPTDALLSMTISVNGEETELKQDTLRTLSSDRFIPFGQNPTLNAEANRDALSILLEYGKNAFLWPRYLLGLVIGNGYGEMDEKNKHLHDEMCALGLTGLYNIDLAIRSFQNILEKSDIHIKKYNLVDDLYNYIKNPEKGVGFGDTEHYEFIINEYKKQRDAKDKAEARARAKSRT